MSPVLMGNQYIYFFWGMKNAGVGHLVGDVLASEPDPFPLFSYIIEFTERYLGQGFYYVWFWLICVIYVVGYFGIIKSLFPNRGYKLFWLVVIPFFLFLHATPIWGFLMRYFLNIDLIGLWDDGVAKQGLLRGYFQPSSMGVLLLWSVERFLKKKVVFAVILAALAGAFHANYLLLGGVLVGVYSIMLIRDSKWLQLALSLVFSFVIVLPYTWYVYQNFTTVGMTVEEVEVFRNALAAVKEENPHLDPTSWLNWRAGFKLLLVLVASAMLRKTRLFSLYLSLVGATVFLSVMALVIGNDLFINLAPWRMSIILVPIAVAVIIGSWVDRAREQVFLVVLLFALLSVVVLLYRTFGNTEALDVWRVSVLVGVGLIVLGFVFLRHIFVNIVSLIVCVLCFFTLGVRTFNLESWGKSFINKSYSELSYEEFMDDDVFLIPPKLTYFRLDVGVPVFVDNNLYFSRNLADWQKRKQMADWFYSLPDEEKWENLKPFKEMGVTVVVLDNRKIPKNNNPDELKLYLDVHHID